MTKKRIPTGIEVLDEMMFGGFIPNTANLIEGAPGTGKTTLGMQFIYNGIVKYNEPGLIITFEEFPKQYYRDALEFGWDFKKLEDEGYLRIIFSDPETVLTEFEKMDGEFVSLMEEMSIKRVLIDSITHFESLAIDTIDLREKERTFINSLKRENVTSILLRENDSLLGHMNQFNSKIPFIVDSYFLLRYVEVDSSTRKIFIVSYVRKME